MQTNSTPPAPMQDSNPQQVPQQTFQPTMSQPTATHGWVAQPSNPVMPSHQQGYNPYQTQGSAAMQPQQQPQGQVVQFPTTYQPQVQQQQQGYPQQQSSNPTYNQQPQGYQTSSQPEQSVPLSLVDRIINTLSTPLRFPSQAQPSQEQAPPTYQTNTAQYQQPTQVYPQQPQQQGQEYQQTLPQTTSFNNSSPQSQQQFQPLPDHLTQMIVNSPAAMASLREIASDQIPYSSSQLNALAVAQEDALNQVRPGIEAGLIMQDLLTNPAELENLLPIVLVNLEQTPGGWDILARHVEAFGQARAQHQNPQGYEQQQYKQAMQQYSPEQIQQIQMQQQLQQPMNQPMNQPMQPQVQQQPMQPSTYGWGNGQTTENVLDARPFIPSSPMPSANLGGNVDLGQIAPDQMFAAVDNLERQGYWRSKPLFQP